MSEPAEHPMALQAPAELALRVLRLEQQLASYQRLHAEELAELRLALAQVKDEVLALAPHPGTPERGGAPLQT